LENLVVSLCKLGGKFQPFDNYDRKCHAEFIAENSDQTQAIYGSKTKVALAMRASSLLLLTTVYKLQCFGMTYAEEVDSLMTALFSHFLICSKAAFAETPIAASIISKSME
uniref:Uncharacterized protein n=1 Tax=Romanomermis culicivorax TaxID=13658 RepID=A0A915HNG5_ROMCU